MTALLMDCSLDAKLHLKAKNKKREKTLLDDDDSCISIALMPVILKFTRTWTNKNEGKDEK